MYHALLSLLSSPLPRCEAKERAVEGRDAAVDARVPAVLGRDPFPAAECTQGGAGVDWRDAVRDGKLAASPAPLLRPALIPRTAPMCPCMRELR